MRGRSRAGCEVCASVAPPVLFEATHPDAAEPALRREVRELPAGELPRGKLRPGPGTGAQVVGELPETV